MCYIFKTLHTFSFSPSNKECNDWNWFIFTDFNENNIVCTKGFAMLSSVSGKEQLTCKGALSLKRGLSDVK